jgi:FtsH-binding integral membrane protein
MTDSGAGDTGSKWQWMQRMLPGALLLCLCASVIAWRAKATYSVAHHGWIYTVLLCAAAGALDARQSWAIASLLWMLTPVAVLDYLCYLLVRSHRHRAGVVPVATACALTALRIGQELKTPLAPLVATLALCAAQLVLLGRHAVRSERNDLAHVKHLFFFLLLGLVASGVVVAEVRPAEGDLEMVVFSAGAAWLLWVVWWSPRARVNDDDDPPLVDAVRAAMEDLSSNDDDDDDVDLDDIDDVVDVEGAGQSRSRGDPEEDMD